MKITDRIYCWLHGIDTDDISEILEYGTNTVIFCKKK